MQVVNDFELSKLPGELELISSYYTIEQEKNVEEIEIHTDYYRIIPTDEWETYDKDVIELGSLDDDIMELTDMSQNPDRPCTYVDFDRAASVLRAISQINNPV